MSVPRNHPVAISRERWRGGAEAWANYRELFDYNFSLLKTFILEITGKRPKKLLFKPNIVH